MPAFVLHERIVATQVHRHGPAAVRAGWHEFRRNPHMFLPFDHGPHNRLIVEGFLSAWHAALEQAIVALRVEQAFAGEPSFLEAVVHIGRDDEIVLARHEFQQIGVHRFRHVVVAVDGYESAPIRPVFLQRGERVEASRIHVANAVGRGEIGEVPFESFAGIGEARRRGQSRSRTDDHGVGLMPRRFQQVKS